MQERIMSMDVVFPCLLLCAGSVSGFILPATILSISGDSMTLNSRVLQVEQNMAILQGTSTQLQAELQRTQTQLQNALTDLQTSKAQQGLMTPDVSFQVRDPPSHILSSTPVKFNTVDYNAGSGYNSITGKFTAPVKGTYMFWTQLEMGGGSNTALYVYIKRTGGLNMAAGYMETGSSFGDVDASAQALGHLEMGQEVWVEVTNAYDIYHSASYFGGALISQG
ncbi:complement C1q-like protein 2 [Haliotis asinina]|uniref:complement C1q-like protein 2 n=1 Tax=Haliotis asinina TaxID=109174 RepID=UPI00353239A2